MASSIITKQDPPGSLKSVDLKSCMRKSIKFLKMRGLVEREQALFWGLQVYFYVGTLFCSQSMWHLFVYMWIHLSLPLQQLVGFCVPGSSSLAGFEVSLESDIKQSCCHYWFSLVGVFVFHTLLRHFSRLIPSRLRLLLCAVFQATVGWHMWAVRWDKDSGEFNDNSNMQLSSMKFK